MENTESTVAIDLALRVTASFIGLLGAFIARRLWKVVSTEYDRSILIRLGTDQDSLRYRWAPVIVGRLPFSDIGDLVRSDLDIRNVIGFVVGTPKWMDTEELKKLRIELDPLYHKPGYYAYCTIQWEHYPTVKRLADQWFHIRRTTYDSNRPEPMMRERIFIGFTTNATPDSTGAVPMIAHVDTGILASFRYQPYLRGGFKAEDIKMRALAPQAKYLIRIKDLFNKEWHNA